MYLNNLLMGTSVHPGQRQVLPVPGVGAEPGVRLRRGLRVPRGRELPQRRHHRLLPPLPAVQPHERGMYIIHGGKFKHLNLHKMKDVH